jgi:excisionase family DNA binding protein
MDHNQVAVKTKTGSRIVVCQGCGTKQQNSFQLLTLAEACGLLRISKPTLLNLLARKAIPGKKVGRCWRLDRAAIVKWVEGIPLSRTHGSKT